MAARPDTQRMTDMRIGRLIIEKRTSAERAAGYRQQAAVIRRGGLGRLGEASARSNDRKAARLERRAAR